ncbi:MAG: hypothetical protein QOI76_223 [Frankiales bacterium]|nr:hypothetical protein [Frankiales bacterium]
MADSGAVTDRRAAAAVGTTLGLWAAAFVAIRVALPGFSVAGLSLGRLIVASAALAATTRLRPVRRPARADLPRIAGCGLAGMTGYQLLLNGGERTVPGGTASLFVATSPIFAAVLALALLREPLTMRARLGIGLGFAGAAVMALAQGHGVGLSIDALLVLAAAVAQALFFVLQKPLLAAYSGFEVTCYAMWAGTVFSLPLSPRLAGDLAHVGGKPLAALLFLGIGPSAIGFVAWAYGQARLPVATAANTLYLVPFLAIGIGWAVLGETVHAAALAGGALALIGVAVSRPSRKPRLRAAPATQHDHEKACQQGKPAGPGDQQDQTPVVHGPMRSGDA